MAAIQAFFARHKTKVTYVALMAFFNLVIWFATGSDSLFLFGLPLAIIFIYFSLNNMKHLWYLMIFLVPLSISDPKFFGASAGVTFPTDFLALGIMFLILFKMASERKSFVRFRSHPIPVIILINFVWIMLSAIPSEMPVVSWKYVAAYSWMLAAFFLFPVMIFKEKRSIFRFFQLISVAFIIAMSTIFFLYFSTGRNPFLLRFNPGPFFVDHTVFGAFCAMWVPILVLLSFRGDFTKRERTLARVALFFFLLGLYFSYSRGAWVSCIAGMGLMGVFVMRKWARRLLVPAFVVLIGIGGYLWYAGAGKTTAKNDAVSRKSLAEHIQSVTNFRTDFSNAERINRWYCAWEMFSDKPWTGYGPGTYAFVYGDYQKARFRTPVSTNRGDNGTAHNEFLLGMSETGWPGGVILLFYFAIPIWCGVRGYHRATNKNTRLLYLAVTFGLITYAIHAWVNNFLDQDKVGGTYLVCLAIITALDLYFLPKEMKEGDQRSSLPT